MYSGSIIKCLDKPVCTAICYTFHQPYRLNLRRPLIDQQLPLLMLQNHFTNILESILEQQMIYNPSEPTKKLFKAYAVGSVSVTKTFMEIFQISFKHAKSIVDSKPKLKHVTKKTILQNYQHLKNAGMELKLIESNALLLAENNEILQEKIKCIKKFADINSGVSLLYYDPIHLENFLNKIIYKNATRSSKKVENQIMLMAKEWQIRDRDLYYIISKYLKYILSSPNNTIKVIKLLLDNNVSYFDLLNLNWAVHCDYRKLKNRLKNCSKFGMTKVEPWILTCSTRKLKSINYYAGKNEFIKFLSENSGYNVEYINMRIKKVRINLSNAKAITNIILKENYDWDDMIWSIKIFGISKEVIFNRFLELRKINHRAPCLNVLLLSEKEFIDYVNKCKNK